MQKKFSMSIEEGLTGGVITASPLSGKKGTRVTVKAVPDSGFRLVSLSANGKTLPPTGMAAVPLYFGKIHI